MQTNGAFPVQPESSGAQGTLEERIRAHLDTLSRGHRLIAEYLLFSPEEAAFLPAVVIGERLKTSESTVVRLAQRLGYPGYPQLQQALQVEIRKRLSPSGMFRTPVLSAGESLFDRVIDADRRNIDRTRAANSNEQLQAAVDLIVNARHTFVMGLRNSHAIAYLAASSLHNVIGRATLLDPAAGLLPDHLNSIEPGDAVLAIGFPRFARLTVEVLEFAKQSGARIIAITDLPLSPIGQHAEITLLASYASVGFAHSGAGALTLVNAIIAGVAFSQRERSLERVRKLDAIHQRFKTHIFQAYDDDRTADR